MLFDGTFYFGKCVRACGTGKCDGNRIERLWLDECCSAVAIMFSQHLRFAFGTNIRAVRTLTLLHPTKHRLCRANTFYIY